MDSHDLCKEHRLWPWSPLRVRTEPLSTSPLAFFPSLGDWSGLSFTLLTCCGQVCHLVAIISTFFSPCGSHWEGDLEFARGGRHCYTRLYRLPSASPRASLRGSEMISLPPCCQFCLMIFWVLPSTSRFLVHAKKYERVSPMLRQILFSCLHIVTSKNTLSSPKTNMFYGRSLHSSTFFYLGMDFHPSESLQRILLSLIANFEVLFLSLFLLGLPCGSSTDKSFGNHLVTLMCADPHQQLISPAD